MAMGLESVPKVSGFVPTDGPPGAGAKSGETIGTGEREDELVEK